MRSPMRILHLEDNPKDAEFVQAMLAAEGLPSEVTRVETQAAFVAALEEGGFDVIISDYTLPSYDGHSALLTARATRPEVPFIFFSGTMGEELAVGALKEGATDYVLKSRPARFAAAVVRALREAEEKADRTRLEEQLRQSQKLESIGLLAGGIAHDFNNLLTVIKGYSGLLLSSVGNDDGMRKDIQRIKEAGDRAALLVRQLLAFSRKQMLTPAVLDLNAVIADIETLLRRLIGEDIALTTSLEPELGHAKADPGQIEQVIMNLAVNARDAMPRGGQLIIETTNIELDEVYAQSHVAVQPGPHVMLAVRDTGCGMDAVTQAHLFEPFFTTKGPGKGTGLGLATVYGIVKQSGGHIQVYSVPGNGTTFKIYLPRVEGIRQRNEPAPVSTEIPHGWETILLVEDEEEVRTLVSKILQMRGYTVLYAQEGAEALHISQSHPGRIHLVLTDMVMPGMSGREVAERLAVARRDIKVMYMSGYTGKGTIHHDVPDPGTTFLQKPFTPEDLAFKVRKALDMPRADDRSSIC